MRATAKQMVAHGHGRVPSGVTGPGAITQYGHSAGMGRTICGASASAGDSTAGTYSPVDFGADPTGQTDSTAAFAAAMAAVVNVTGRAARPMASGIVNLGGATLDLGGGQYLIGAPLVIPPFTGNVRIRGGTLRASASFPGARFLIEVGDSACTPKGSQGVCNEFVAVEDMFLDGGHVAAGGIAVYKTMGTTVGPSAFITGFNVAGVLVEAGHETMVRVNCTGATHSLHAAILTATGLVIIITPFSPSSPRNYTLPACSHSNQDRGLPASV